MEASASQVDRCAARVGQWIRGKWRLERLIDVGGMSAVYAATHRNGHRVAIKMLHPEVAVLPDMRERFLKEGYVANRVEHPGAVRVQDDDQAEDGSAFIVMELLDGETLHTRIDRHGGRLPPEDVLRVIDKVLEVLAAAHERQILHRDVKPSNIFITQAAEVKLLDFGIARFKQTGVQTYTLPGLVLGTPGFVPPEQALGRSSEIDPRSDLWAVGATMFTAIAGRSVHVAETPNEQVVLAATQPAPSLGSVSPDVPRVVVDVVDRALQFYKQNRFGSANEMRTAIHEAFHRLHGDRLSEGNQTVPLAAGLRAPGLDFAGAAAPNAGSHGGFTPSGATPEGAYRRQTSTQKMGDFTPAAATTGERPMAPMGSPPDAGSGRHLPPTVLAYPSKQHLTPHGVVAPQEEPEPHGDAARYVYSYRNLWIAGAGFLLACAVVVGLLLRRPAKDEGPPVVAFSAQPSLQPDPAPIPSSSAESPPSSPQPAETPRSPDPSLPGPATGALATPQLPPPTTTAAPTAAEKSTGILNINSIPVSRVVLDGRPLGTTPKIGITVPAGPHTITFVHPEKGKKSVSVTVKSGETKTVATKF